MQSTYKVSTIPFPNTTSIGIKPISKEGSDRLIRAAIDYAIKYKKPSVTLVHKGNIMKFTEGSFCKWGYELAATDYKDHVITTKMINELKANSADYVADFLKDQQTQGKVILQDCIADAFFQNSLLYPGAYSVVATTNLNGDYISDALAAQVGGIGISPGANINYHTGHAVFEATHGTAPDIVGQDKANPSALLLSAVMMLSHLGLDNEANQIKAAIQRTIKQGVVTADLATSKTSSVSTTDFVKAIIKNQ